ncbi:MAG: TetR/AcrR family transcriptional regulator C-terminal domain-containing protein [Bacillota bacterium]|nr:TetR/AcrR family transcriptional regulator C-terminal domain-containing protein [Bacillota bacterium]
MSYSQITKKALAGAMKELMETQSFEKIRVGDVCEKCGMNRKSFYYHFRDKYDLVNWIYYTEFVDHMQKREYQTIWDFMEDVCAYLYENKAFYANALQVRGQNSLSESFEAVFQSVFLSYYKDVFPRDEGRHFYAAFLTDAVKAAILRWLTAEEELAPEEFVALLKNMVKALFQKMLREQEDEKKED